MDAQGKEFFPLADEVCRKLAGRAQRGGVEEGAELTGQSAADAGQQLHQGHGAQGVALTRRLEQNESVSGPLPEHPQQGHTPNKVPFSPQGPFLEFTSKPCLQS